jgi:hypothetical protein
LLERKGDAVTGAPLNQTRNAASQAHPTPVRVSEPILDRLDHDGHMRRRVRIRARIAVLIDERLRRLVAWRLG